MIWAPPRFQFPFEALEWIVHTCSQRNVLHIHAFLWRKWWISIVISTILVYNGLLRMFSCLDAIALRIFQKTNERCPQPPASSTLCTHDSPRNTRRVLSCRFCNKQNGSANGRKEHETQKKAGPRPQHSTNGGEFWSIRGLALQPTHTILWSSNNLSSRKGRHCNGVSTLTNHGTTFGPRESWINWSGHASKCLTFQNGSLQLPTKTVLVKLCVSKILYK